MDTITQAALGAAVGEVVLGKKVGNKAMIYGAIAGTIPDLDVFLRPFYSDLEYFGYHRGFSHSIVFAILFAAVFAYFIDKWHKESGSDWKGWSWLAFWAIVTHPILDSFTVYGTQLFLPFSNYPVAFNNIFIIDPIYTVPLLFGVIIAAFFRRENKWRSYIHYFFFGLAQLYLLITIVTKIYVHSIFMDNFEAQNIDIEHTFSTPMMFNILWGTASASKDTIYVGSYSFYDNDKDIAFTKIPKNSQLIQGQEETRAIQKLNWFSRGINIIYQENDSLFWADLRFGFPSQHVDSNRNFTFAYHLVKDDKGNIVDLERYSSTAMRGGLTSGSFWERAMKAFEPVFIRMFNEDGKH